MTRIALVDGDYIAYRCAASCEPSSTRPGRDPEFVALGRASDICERIGSRVTPTEFRIYLGGPRNFRKLLDPSYKANRLHKPVPEHLGAVRDFLVRKWGATVLTDAYEVDDRLGIEAADNTVICAIDKDLRQIPGEHYNPTKDVFEVVDPQAAAIALYTSMVVGDAADNLRGIDGLGPVKAGRLLRACSAEEAHSVVSGLYQERDQDFFLAYRLFRLLRSTEEYWEIMNEIAVSQGEGPEATTDSEGHAIGGVTGVILQ